MTPRSASIPYPLSGKFYRLAFEEWGDRDAPAVLCVHGLTRNAGDFDSLAAALAATHVFNFHRGDAPWGAFIAHRKPGLDTR